MTQLVNIAASVRQRLLNRARAENRVFQELATLFAMERFLYRLGHSAHADQFVLKGGLIRKSHLSGLSLHETVEAAAALAEPAFDEARKGSSTDAGS